MNKNFNKDIVKFNNKNYKSNLDFKMKLLVKVKNILLNQKKLLEERKEIVIKTKEENQRFLKLYMIQKFVNNWKN